MLIFYGVSRLLIALIRRSYKFSNNSYRIAYRNIVAKKSLAPIMTNVIPIPGPNAAIAALSSSGIASSSFSFFGFLPAKQASRLKLLKTKRSLDETIIFYESPKRILATIKDMMAVFGETRRVCLAKELTKSFETILNDNLERVMALLRFYQRDYLFKVF